ncbi:uroporphyrinogen-III C-methyltransferase [Jiulongibacter sediminis]|jgi:uroporphyrin-III C-methyltransferase|uniref:uroporphyrinogen-III C-methyltransferase n=1 Tax=Jiulongibacter sediminis TaxID=1605367 RepID=UPI0026EC011D|nr:uroporphyrinogen-III C-methyltransferase [Jiulongibacter sediminis]
MKLSLIGAGPGDAELITLKAIRRLNEADVILYDALANQALLGHAEPKAEIIYVGKRKGQHSVSQEEINRIIVTNVLSGKHVVRLKGGDPVIFGRGFEEMDMVKKLGIYVEIIPGISSSVGVPTLAGVPVTKRGISESYWVLTGHTKSGKLPKDMALAAQSNATVIVLMGMSKLSEICDIFSNAGKDKLPVAIIQDGTTERQKIAVAQVNSICDEVASKGLKNPAVIVFGETVKCSPDYVMKYLQKEVLAYA